MFPKFYNKYPTPSYNKLLIKRLKLYNNQRKNIMNKAQIEIEAGKLLSSKAVRILKEIGSNAMAEAELAHQLLDELVASGAVQDTVTYAEFANNVALKKAMLAMIGCSLSDNLVESRLYGKGIISHFDLFNNCGTNAKFNAFLAKINYDAEGNPAMVSELMKGRDNLYALMVRTRNNTIENMELMGTPDKKVESAKKKPAPILTKEDAIKKANEKVSKVAESVQAIESAKRKAIDEEGDDVDDAEMDDSFDSPTPPASDVRASAVDVYTNFMQDPKFQLLAENDQKLLQRQRDSLEWVVRVFADVQIGAIGIGYFYDPETNSGCIVPLPTELEIMKKIYKRPTGNVVFETVRTEEEILGLPKKKGGKGGKPKAVVPSQATDSDSIA